jgi:sulfide dehydrogenase cytochrome subunit
MYYNKKWPYVGIVLALPLLFSCQKNFTETESQMAKSDQTSPQMLAATMDIPGRTLAANCFQCHGTNGYASELKIAGIGGAALTTKFAEMKARGARDNIMNVHAYAYTPEEILLMGTYFSKQ